jgi:transaldolase
MLVQDIKSVIEASGSDMEIIAASIKTPAEAVDAHLAGGHHLTLPLNLIESIDNQVLSDLANEDFHKSRRDSS